MPSNSLRHRPVEALAAYRTGKTPGATSTRTAVSRRVSEIEREEVAWLWLYRIPLGKLTLVDGDPGLGKSWLTLAIAAAVSNGSLLPGEEGDYEPANVILMNAEDGPGDTIRPRLEDMGADLGRVILLEGLRDKRQERAVTLTDLDVIEDAIGQYHPALVVVDPLVAFTGQVDTHVASRVRSLLAPLNGLAERHKVAVIAVRHLTKSQDTKAAYRGQASIDFLAACRSAFLVAENPQDQEQRVLIHIKTNLGPKMPTLTFSTEGGFVWGGEASVTAEEALADHGQGENTSQLGEAKEFLQRILHDGPVRAPELFSEARAAGIAEKTLRRAKEALGVGARKDIYGKFQDRCRIHCLREII